MSDFKSFAKAGHWPTLAASFLYFDFCFPFWQVHQKKIRLGCRN
jgi:hypothetical protein